MSKKKSKKNKQTDISELQQTTESSDTQDITDEDTKQTDQKDLSEDFAENSADLEAEEQPTTAIEEAPLESEQETPPEDIQQDTSPAETDDSDLPVQKIKKEKRGKIKLPKPTFIKWPAVDYIIAISPLLIWATMLFGTKVLVVAGIAVATAVAFELLCSLIARRSLLDSISFPIVIGMITACLLPYSAPLWLPAMAVATVMFLRYVVNVLLKLNFLNPFAAMMVILSFALPEVLNVMATDGNVAYTPLYYLQNGIIPEIELFDLALGKHYGLIGEISILLIAAAFLYLVIRKVIKWHTPVAMLAVAFGYHYLLRPGEMNTNLFVQYSLLSGAIVFGAVFIATEFSAAPKTTGGRLLFGILCGALTMFLRTIPEVGEGVFLAILLVSLITPALDAPFQKLPFAKKS